MYQHNAEPVPAEVRPGLQRGRQPTFAVVLSRIQQISNETSTKAPETVHVEGSPRMSLTAWTRSATFTPTSWMSSREHYNKCRSFTRKVTFTSRDLADLKVVPRET